MIKPSAPWRPNVRSVSSLLAMLMVLTPALAIAEDPTITGQVAGQAVLGEYGSKEAFNVNIAQPVTQAATPLTTIDGSASGSGQITAPSSRTFVQVAVQPAATGDLAQVRVFEDLNLDGQYEYSYTVPTLASGVCANGIISCRAGTWLECKPLGWAADADGRVSLVDIPLDDLGGCYCINSSCGSNLIWNNLPLVLKDLGGGVVGAVQQRRPSFIVTDVSTDDATITYYGMDAGRTGSDESGAPLSGRAEETRYYQSPSLLTSDTEAAILAQSADPDSYYAMASTSLQNRMEVGELSTCVIERVIQIPTQESFCPIPTMEGSTWVHDDIVSVFRIIGNKLYTIEGDYESGGTGITFRDIDLTMSYLGPRRSDSWMASRLVVSYDTASDTSKLAGYRATYFGDSSGELGSELTARNTRIRLFDATGQEVTQLDLMSLSCTDNFNHESGETYSTCTWVEPFYRSGLWVSSYASGDTVYIQSSRGRTLGRIKFEQHPQCPLTGGTACFGTPLRCTKYDLIEGVDDRCLALENNPDCSLRDETVDGVVTYRTFQPSGLTPFSSCRTFDLPMPWVSTSLCRDWWRKERTYLCKGTADFDFTDAKRRMEAVNQSVDGTNPAAGSVQYTDMRKDADTGVWTTDTHTLQWNVPAPSAGCQQVCKTRKTVDNASVNMNGPVTNERTTPDQYEFAYKVCTGNASGVGGTTCPIESGETILKACQCLNEFADAASALTALQEAARDMICTSGVRR